MVKQSNTKKTKVQTMKKDNSKSTDLKKRYFKCIYVDEKTKCVNCVGRYSGKKPKQAANKALTALTKNFKEQGINTNGLKINFGVIEQTRGSKRKKYYYHGTRNTLKKPVPVSIKKTDKKTGKVTTEVITYKHQSTVKKISCDKCPELVAFNPKKELLDDNEEVPSVTKESSSVNTSKKPVKVKAEKKQSVKVKAEKNTKIKKVKVAKKNSTSKAKKQIKSKK